MDISNSIAVDNNENVITIGTFRGTVDFDPGIGTLNLTAANFGSVNGDMFISKLTSQGDLVWVKQFACISFGFANGVDIALDVYGNIYATGAFMGTVDFDPGQGILNYSSGSGYADIFIIKLNAFGDLVWTKQMMNNGGAWHNYNKGNSIAVDLLGNVYSTGIFQGSVDFDPGFGIFNLTSTFNNSLNQFTEDIFITKLNAYGDLEWAKRIGGDAYDESNALALDEWGNVYTTGRFANNVDFDPGPFMYNLTSGYVAMFVSKLNSQGDFIWTKQIGSLTGNGAVGNSMVLDSLGNIHITGRMLGGGLVDFDPGPGTFNTSYSDGPIFVNKLNNNGEFIWVKHLAGGGSTAFGGTSIDLDALGNVYSMGTFSGASCDFDPGTGSFFMQTNSYTVSSGDRSLYLSKLNNQGDFLWAKKFNCQPANGTYNDNLYGSLKVASTGNIYLTGHWNGYIDLDPNIGNYDAGVSNYTDIFIAKLNECSNTNNSITLTQCGSYLLNGNLITQSGIYSQIIPNSLGCDSTIIINLTITNITANDTSILPTCFGLNDAQASVSALNGTTPYSYLWNNGSTTASINGIGAGTYTYTVNDANGCSFTDSIEVANPMALMATTSVNPVNQCSGPCNGSAIVSPIGGTQPYSYLWDSNANSQTSAIAGGLCIGSNYVTVTDGNGCSFVDSVTISVTPTVNNQVYLTNIAAVDQINVDPSFASYYTYDLPNTINSNATNPLNLVDPGKSVRFKVQSKNQKSNGQSIVSGSCRVRSNSPWITLTDSTSGLNNIAWNSQAWSVDEFEMNINANTPPGTNVYLDFIVQENNNNYSTTCIAIPVTPLVYSPTSTTTIDDDNNPDSQGNDNDICEPGETIEFYPLLDNISNFNANYVRGSFQNLSNNSFINIWNNQAGTSGPVYNSSWWNYSFANPQPIYNGDTLMSPEFDFVFDYNNGAASNNFNLEMVMAGGFNLFSSNGPLTLVKWSLPYTFSGTSNPVGIASDFNSAQFSIYPNPSTSIINIESKNINSNATVKIFDALGKVVATEIVNTQNSSINIQNLSSGVYVVELQDNEIVERVKITKL